MEYRGLMWYNYTVKFINKRSLELMKKYLILENGMTLEGESFGANVDTVAEIVFSTSMVGYVEALTDPRYVGQAVCMTFPVIGNYGVCEKDCERDLVMPSALIVREYCDTPSNFRSEETLDELLKKHGVPAISGIDTRLLTKTLRTQGTMNGAIVSDPSSVSAEAIRAYRIKDAVGRVSTKSVSLYTSEEKGEHHTVALLDLGVTKSVLCTLNGLGCDVYVLPHTTSAEAILALSPDGIFVSGGPGDPAECTGVVETLSALIPARIPTMAVGLGHQLLAAANGMELKRLPHGHRGGNQPVREVETGRLYITSQNHGYSVAAANATAVESYVNVNDGTNEGLCYRSSPAFSVQFTPHSDELYRSFVRMLG